MAHDLILVCFLSSPRISDFERSAVRGTGRSSSLIPWWQENIKAYGISTRRVLGNALQWYWSTENENSVTTKVISMTTASSFPMEYELWIHEGQWQTQPGPLIQLSTSYGMIDAMLSYDGEILPQYYVRASKEMRATFLGGIDKIVRLLFINKLAPVPS